jgi:hypothetical protein
VIKHPIVTLAALSLLGTAAAQVELRLSGLYLFPDVEGTLEQLGDPLGIDADLDDAPGVALEFKYTIEDQFGTFRFGVEGLWATTEAEVSLSETVANIDAALNSFGYPATGLPPGTVTLDLSEEFNVFGYFATLDYLWVPTDKFGLFLVSRELSSFKKLRLRFFGRWSRRWRSI